jgi:hypothetical protein
MTGRGTKRKQPKSPVRKRRSVDGPMDRLLKKINDVPEVAPYVHTNRANLCGQVDLDVICDIIREWVSTEEGTERVLVPELSKLFTINPRPNLIDSRSFGRRHRLH